MFDIITVPVDGSKYSDKAVDYAIAIAKKFNSKIAAVHVLNEFSSNTFFDEEDVGNEILGKVTEKANEFGVDVIEHLITGNPLRDMKMIIRKTCADLVILHAFGSNLVDENLNENQIGSVSERVVRTSNIPVLIVR